ncbi:MAG: AEC family transporter, partial [Endomicrobiales bacterium]
MLSLLASLVVRVFSFILLGALLQRSLRERGERAAAAVIRFALYVLIPLYMLLSMWSSPLSPERSWRIAAAALLVTAAGAFLAFAWSRARRIPFGVQCLPIIFMNSAYLAIPVNTLLWGAAGTTCTIIYNAVITVMTFTFGVWCVSKERPFAEIATLPVLYGTAAGILLNALSVPVPGAAAAAGRFVSLVTLPLMLVFVGYRLGKVTAAAFGPALGGALLRMGGGYLAGLLAVF